MSNTAFSPPAAVCYAAESDLVAIRLFDRGKTRNRGYFKVVLDISLVNRRDRAEYRGDFISMRD